ncbi:MAG: hypothetical protein LBD01_00805, partial [Puniceicoccales bacterium]|nr:hypothetical protein [Puniceicoccales bacterium]
MLDRIDLYIQNTTTSQDFAAAIQVESGALFSIGSQTANGTKVVVLQNNKSNDPSAAGGAIRNKGTMNVNMTTLRASYNEATFGGAIANVGSGSSIVLGYVAEFKGNQARESGGAIYNTTGNSVILSSATVARFGFPADSSSGNVATLHGGAIYNEGTFTSYGSINPRTFTRNQAGGDGGAIHNTSGGEMTISGSEFRFGYYETAGSGNQAGGDGGAIYNSGSGSEINMTAGAFGIGFYHNQALRGGAISNKDDAVISLTSSNIYFGSPFSYIDGNSAEIGGAIYNDAGGDISITASTELGFYGNEASVGSGGAIYNAASSINFVGAGRKIFQENVAAGSGGAINNTGDSTDNGIITFQAGVASRGISFLRNTATSGGAIYNDSWGSILIYEDVIFGNVSFDAGTGTIVTMGNIATTTAPSTGGGAIYNKGIVHIQNDSTIFADNKASGGSFGGAIFNDGQSGKNASLTIGSKDAWFGVLVQDSTKRIRAFGNESARGGAIYNGEYGELFLGTQDGTTTFVGNLARAGGYGGAVYKANGIGEVTVYGKANFGLVVTDPYSGKNMAFGNGYEEKEDFSRAALTGRGGAIYLEGGSIILENAEFVANRSTGHGGAVYLEAGTLRVSGTAIFGSANTEQELGGNLAGAPDGLGASAAASGGALYNSVSAEFISEGFASFSGNSATYQGGSIFNAGLMSFNIISFSSNAVDKAGDVVGAPNTAVQGGGIFNAHGATLTIGSGLFDDSTATGAIVEGQFREGQGGGIYNVGTLNMTTAEFGDYFLGTGNHASHQGGGLYNDSGTQDFTVSGAARFSGNSAGEEGGAIYVKTGNVSLGASDFRGNIAQKGGAAYVESSGSLNFGSEAFFQWNRALSFGGGIYAELGTGGTLTLENVRFYANSAVTGGGAIYVEAPNAGKIIINNAIAFEGNTAAVLRGAAIETNASIDIITVHDPAVLGSGHTLFTGNISGVQNNAMHFLSGSSAPITLTVNTVETAAKLDMRDPISSANLTNDITIEKKGTGTWLLGGKTLIQGTGQKTFNVSAGTLYLYREGEVANVNKQNNGHVVEAGIVDLGKTTSTFTLASGTTLAIGGGNTITAGTVNMGPTNQFTVSGRTFSFDLGAAVLQDTGSMGANAMLKIDANSVSGFLGIGANSTAGAHLDLLSLAKVAGKYELVAGINGTTILPVSQSASPAKVYLRGTVIPVTGLGRIPANTFAVSGGSGANGLITLEQKQVVSNQLMNWTGAGASGIWNISNGEWERDNAQGPEITFLHGDVVNFLLQQGTSHNINIDVGGAEVAGMNFSGADDYHFSGGDLIIQTAGTTISDPSLATGKLSLGYKANETGGHYTAGPIPYSGTVDLSKTVLNEFENGVSLYSGRLLIASLAQLGTELSNVRFLKDLASETSLGAFIHDLTLYGKNDPLASGPNGSESFLTDYGILPTLCFVDPALGSSKFLVYGNNTDTKRIALESGMAGRIDNALDVYWMNVDSTKNGTVFNVGEEAMLLLTGSMYVIEQTKTTVSGGAVYNEGAFVALPSMMFNQTEAGGNGGAIYNGTDGTGDPTVYIQSGTFVRGMAGGSGGAIYNKSGAVFGIGTVTANYNAAILNGGTLYNSEGANFRAYYFNSQFNRASSGGSIFNAGSFHLETNFEDLGSKAEESGGTIYNTNTGTIVIGGDLLLDAPSAKEMGGGIYNGGHITVGGNLEAHYAKAAMITNAGDFGGGFLYNTTGAHFEVHGNTWLEGNSVGQTKDVPPQIVKGSGGAIHNSGTAIFSGSFNAGYNKVHDDTGSGGAIYNVGIVKIGNGSSGGTYRFEQNSAGNYGGAIANYAGAELLFDVDATDRVVFIGNTADRGGAIFNEALVARGDVPSVPQGLLAYFENNSADAGGAIVNEAQGRIYLATEGGSAGSTDPRYVNFSGNTAVSRGGAIYNRDNGSEITIAASTARKQHPIFEDNQAAFGGAIYNYEGAVFIDGSNMADNIPIFYKNYASYSGGAIHNGQAMIDIIVSTRPFVMNTALNEGGAIANLAWGVINITSNGNMRGLDIFERNYAGYDYNGVEGLEGRGGAISNRKAELNINLRGGRALFSNNLAVKMGGGIYNCDTGEVKVTLGNLQYLADQNRATAGDSNGGFIYNTGAGSKINVETVNYASQMNPEGWLWGLTGNKAGQGGAIYNTSGGKVTLRFPNLSYSMAYQNQAVMGEGGVIYNTGSDSNITIEVWGTTVSRYGFAQNIAATAGGAIYNAAGGVVTYSGAALHNNHVFFNNLAITSAVGGGAIYNTGTDSTVNLDVKIAEDFVLFNNNGLQNAINGKGGAIYNDLGGKININLRDGSGETVGLFVANGVGSTNGSGGAVYNTGTNSEIIITNSAHDTKLLKINDNSGTSGGGGAIYNDNGAKLTIAAGPAALEFKNNRLSNTVSGSGGTIYNAGSISSQSLISLSSDKSISFSLNRACDGGAIANHYQGILNLTAPIIQFSNNGSRLGAGEVNVLGKGGVIYNQGAEINLVGTVEMINDPAITQAQDGGLIYNDIGGGVYFGVQNPAADS